MESPSARLNCQVERNQNCGVESQYLGSVEEWSSKMFTIYLPEPMNTKGAFKGVHPSLSQVSKGTQFSQHLALSSVRPVWASDLHSMKTGHGRPSVRARLSHVRGFLCTKPDETILKIFPDTQEVAALTYPVGNGHTGNQYHKRCTSCQWERSKEYICGKHLGGVCGVGLWHLWCPSVSSDSRQR